MSTVAADSIGHVCIVGLGLMGGSLAMALRGHVAGLVGVERRALTRQLALERRIVDWATEDPAAGMAGADLVILGTPVRAILETLEELPALRPSGCRVLDLGSTKQAIHEAMSKLPHTFQAVGGHPMCGKETAGLAAATANLYRGQTFVLCRNRRTTPEMEQLALRLIDVIGARPAFLDATDHDAIVASVSHLPYLLAAALMRLVDQDHSWAVSASGFRDASRLAGTDPQMMLDILLTNRLNVMDALSGYEAELALLRRLLETGDEAALLDWLAAAQVNHAAYRRFKSAADWMPQRLPDGNPPV